MVQIYQSMQKIWSKYNFLVKIKDFQILSRTGQMEILILSRTRHTKCEISWKRKVHMVKLLVLFNTYIRVTSGRTEHFLCILLILSISLRRVRDKCDFFWQDERLGANLALKLNFFSDKSVWKSWHRYK